MGIAANLLPALGFAMLAQMIWNKQVAPFFFLGFFLVAYAHLNTTGVAVFAVLLAIIMYIFIDKQQDKKEQSSLTGTKTEGDGFDEF